MPDHPHIEPEPPRRRALRMGAAAALAGLLAPVAAIAQANPDAALIRLCDGVIACQDQIEAVFADAGRIGDDAAEAQAAAIMGQLAELTLQIDATDATTPDGIAAIARALGVHAGHGGFQLNISDATTSGRMMQALLRSALRQGCLPVHAALIPGNSTPPSQRPPAAMPSTDAALIEACRRFVAVQGEMVALHDIRTTVEIEERTEPELDRMCADAEVLLARMESLPNATTSAGVEWLARAALACAERDREGEIVTTHDDDWLASRVVQSIVARAA